MIAQPLPVGRLSDLHLAHHRTCMRLARQLRDHGESHARQLQLAATARLYFAQLRAIGD
ncbi:hypothetical protein J2W32_006513 [Variovorax boronicumulans]|uniref:Uncharacterized protein n=1 Tax=Variovorax boronicumulans TaxID=436515 RepID=A0AAW8DBD8_9BURK|nr:hypothetical protein [Variovorax boronicumulans]MDP9897423.1 hypothetical protein [Variovorax boronicumulans]MDQ0057436.1 hypothetical protein [Variovorax boronicumulans]